MEKLAIRVRVVFKDGKTEVFENVTEIHYNYESTIAKITGERRIALESDIDSTGSTHLIDNIEEFEAELTKVVERDENKDSV